METIEKNGGMESCFATENVRKLILQFATPAVVAAVVNSLYNIVDQIFIGRGVGYLGNGATNVIFPLTIIALAFAQMLGDGAAAYLSLKLGEGKKADGERAVNNAVTMLMGVLFMILGLIFLMPLALLFGTTENILPYALEYGRVIVIGLPFFIVSVGLNSILRADGSPQVSMTSMLAGAVFNVIFDPVLIYAAHWGVTGAAIATVGGQIITCAIYVFHLRKLKTVRLDARQMKPSLHYTGETAKLGVSSFVVQLSIVVSMFVANNMLVRYGALSKYGADIPLTVMGIVMKVNQILMGVIVGIGTGSQPVLGYNYGAGKYDRVRQAFRFSMGIALAFGTLAFCLFEFWPQAVINLFGSEEGLYNELARKCFRIFLMLCACNAFHAISCVFFQAVGASASAAVLSMLRQIIVVVPAMLLLPLAMGVDGVLWAGPIADGISFIAALALILCKFREIRANGLPVVALSEE